MSTYRLTGGHGQPREWLAEVTETDCAFPITPRLLEAPPFYGSIAGIHLNQAVVAVQSTDDGQGYWFVASDGGIFSYGDAPFRGSMGGQP